MNTTEIIRNPNRKVDEEFMTVVRDVMEPTEDITILNIFEKDNNVYGLYIHSIDKKLSFLSHCNPIIEKSIDNIKIVLFELGSVLYHIYHAGAIKFIDLFSVGPIIKQPDEYFELYKKVCDNVPLNIYKLKFFEALQGIGDYDDEKSVDNINYLKDSALSVLQYIDDVDDQKQYLSDDVVESETDFLKCYNQLNDFNQFLKERKFDKISEKNIFEIDKLYKKIQKIYK